MTCAASMATKSYRDAAAARPIQVRPFGELEEAVEGVDRRRYATRRIVAQSFGVPSGLDLLRATRWRRVPQLGSAESTTRMPRGE